uniref:Putative ovule protein n=1 Tax=Solanum chacoense TaxID=4108 RepID=A0A0V0HB20_SOLCH
MLFDQKLYLFFDESPLIAKTFKNQHRRTRGCLKMLINRQFCLVRTTKKSIWIAGSFPKGMSIDKCNTPFQELQLCSITNFNLYYDRMRIFYFSSPNNSVSHIQALITTCDYLTDKRTEDNHKFIIFIT